MIYLYAFLFSGTICLIGELVYQKTKLTPGHISSFLVVLGAILEGCGVYKYLVKIFGGGITCLITNFGALLVEGSIEKAKIDGIFGVFSGIFSKTSGLISFTVFLAIIASFIPKFKKNENR